MLLRWLVDQNKGGVNMNRNVEQIVANAKINLRYDMNVDTLVDFVEKGSKSKSALANVIHDAFKFGYVMGQRSSKA